MPYSQEFPALSKITNNMDVLLLREVGLNLEYYNIDVRIDYARWIQYQAEYNEWSNLVQGNEADAVSNTRNCWVIEQDSQKETHQQRI
jgi:hypothetical protein